MAQILMILGLAIMGILGTIHLVFTFFTNKFNAFDITVTEGMKNSTLILTKETSVWNAWIGFNASHSLGVMFFAAIYIYLCLFHFSIVKSSVWLAALPVLFSLCYLVLAIIYWFSVPFMGILISTVCFVCAFSLIVLKISQ